MVTDTSEGGSVRTVSNMRASDVCGHSKVKEPKTLLQRAKTEPLRKNIQENQDGKVSVQNRLKPVSGEAELL
ncbi:hypothetical protein llap_18620 [Limosa lapponica baueri]|uniref:Uncharacterized protein n=1 Tax=Limosa lapponica baueri TaxID=1758121 RepID=A0A2I0TBB6_LIMLA|nr:hypothetical protein llap_18620 [Limosa lapponica baueri]